MFIGPCNILIQGGSNMSGNDFFNLLAPELFFLILAQPEYKMWIIQEPNTLELWKKLHFEEEETESIYKVQNIRYLYLLNKYIKCNFGG